MNRIAIDIDEVLVPFLKSMSKYHNKTITKTRYSYVYRNIFDITEEESQKMVQEFYRSQAFTQLTPMRGAQRAMYKIRRRADRMYIVTGRQDTVRDETEDWIDTFFPNIFDDVILTNSYTPHEVKKSDICRALNIGLIIDDNKGICDQCIEAGMNALNYIGDDEIYPWCEESDISIKGWDALEL
jgi:5'(3')-deoxyribonucleotidase